MSYLKKYQWELMPKSLPIVRRNCPKCNEKSHYISSEKFRVNANKNSIDIWLIYQCEKCKSTWNMAIYERIKPYDIDKNEYGKFLSNDRELAMEYAFNISIYNKNKAEVIMEDIDYELIQRKLEAYYVNEDEFVIDIISKYPIDLRADKLLSDNLGISRSKIKNMNKMGEIFIKDNRDSLNIKIKDKMEIHVLNIMANLGSCEAIEIKNNVSNL